MSLCAVRNGLTAKEYPKNGMSPRKNLLARGPSLDHSLQYYLRLAPQGVKNCYLTVRPGAC